MQHLMIFLLVIVVISCASTRNDQRQEGKNRIETEATRTENNLQPTLVVVTSHLDVDPEPIGGAAAIQAAVQEPEEVWKENKTGTAVVEARVNANGKIMGTKVHKSSGHAGMDAEAMLAVSRVRWKPARKRNKPVEALVRVTINFSSSVSAK